MDAVVNGTDALSWMNLIGKTAVVFGGANGIGAAVCSLFAASGAKVAIADLDGTQAESRCAELTEAGMHATAWQVDTADEEAVLDVVARIAEWAGSVDIAVLSVYQDHRAPIVTLDRRDWDRVLDVTLSSGYAIARSTIPHMVARGAGSLVFISSIQARLGLPDEPAYAAAKAGLCGLVRQIAVQYGEAGVRANAILPSAVIVDRNRTRWTNPMGGRAAVRSAFPLGRVGYPEDVARAALFLASDASAFVTGVELPVDGGLSVCPATKPIWDAEMDRTGSSGHR